MTVSMHSRNQDFPKRGQLSSVTMEKVSSPLTAMPPKGIPCPILFPFLFLLLTWRLSFNYPGTVLIVWIYIREQWRGNSIRRVGDDVPSTFWEAQTYMLYTCDFYQRHQTIIR